jgi:hypothetical protein
MSYNVFCLAGQQAIAGGARAAHVGRRPQRRI